MSAAERETPEERDKRLARERQRKRRERIKAGLVPISLDVDEVDAAVALGLDDPMREVSREELQAELQRAFDEFLKRRVTP